MKRVSNFFLFVAGIDTKLMAQCPKVDHGKHVSIGVAIVLTTLFAAFSSYYAFYLLTKEIFTGLVLALLWALLIFNIDRFLVSSFRYSNSPVKNMTGLLPRLLLTICIAVVIAKPIELKLFEPELKVLSQQQQHRLFNEIDIAYLEKIKLVEDKIIEKEQGLAQLFQKKEAYYEAYRCECDGTCGTKRYGRGEECERKMEKYEAFSIEYLEIRRNRLEAIETLVMQMETIRKKSDIEKEAFTIPFEKLGLAARLSLLGNMPGSAGFFLMLLLIVVESMPILTKIIVGPGSYEKLLQQVEHSFKVVQNAQMKKADLLAASLFEEELSFSQLEIKRQEHEFNLRSKHKAMQSYRVLRQRLNKEVEGNDG